PADEPHLVGPAALIGAMEQRPRRLINAALFVVAAGVILAAAEPFAESLVHVGQEFGISTFLLVKWVAPLASESPELLVAALFAWRLSPAIGLGALVSSKVNQWTLLVGTLPLVFAISSSSTHGLPLGIQQRDELLVTAAQTVFAVAIMANLSMSRGEAWVMLTLFVAQFASSGILPEEYAAPGRIAVGVIFMLAAAWVLRRGHLRGLRTVITEGLTMPYDELTAQD
ncbi:MAG: sodium/calcium exchanger protein, partial [Acidimicrobiia bacterium]|nr:sodium/calcium exchanger protein [Acidimicrobiia bacterium]